MPDERVAVHIDGSNLYHSLRSAVGRIDLDFTKFSSKLVGGRRLVRTYYYIAEVDAGSQPEATAAQQRFLNRMRSVEYLELRLGRLVYGDWPHSPAHEKGVDIKIATDMLIHGSTRIYDAAILVSGDTDFVDALQALKNLGRHVEVALFGPRRSRLLREVADRVIEIDEEFLAGCWRNN